MNVQIYRFRKSNVTLQSSLLFASFRSRRQLFVRHRQLVALRELPWLAAQARGSRVPVDGRR